MQIKPNIYNVGTERDNAYLIIGDRNALIDTVPQCDAAELIGNIEEIMPVNKLDYLVLNHTEQNKSGAAGDILKLNRDIEVVASVAGLRNLKEMLNCSFNEHIAKDGSSICVGGGMILRFLITPNLNWPDSMITYEEKNRLLFTCDIFSEKDEKTLAPHSEYVKTALERMRELDIDAILAGSGSNIEGDAVSHAIQRLNADATSEKRDVKKVVIIFSSMYGNTREMAECIRDTLISEGIECVMSDACVNSEDAVLEAHNADALAVGTYTVDKGADPNVLRFLSSLKPMQLRHKPFFAFGSYGWSGEGPQIVHGLLKSYGMGQFSKPFMSIFKMSDENAETLRTQTRSFAKFISQEN